MPVINKVAYDYPTAEVGITICRLKGTQLETLVELPIADGNQEINYTPKREVEEMFGSARDPQDFTDGSITYEASLTFLFYWWRYIINTCNELGVGWAQVRLNIGVTYNKPGLPVEVDTIYNTLIMGMEAAFKRGNENLMVPMPLKPQRIYYNGRDPFGRSLT